MQLSKFLHYIVCSIFNQKLDDAFRFLHFIVCSEIFHQNVDEGGQLGIVLVYLCNFIALHIVFFTQMNLTCFLYVLCVVAVMCPLYYYHQSHPINLVLLGLFTVAISLTVGIVCALTEGMFF